MSSGLERVRTILVPRGAEAAAVRRALDRRGDGATTRLLALPAGRVAAASLPDQIDEPILVMGLCGALRGRSVGDVVVYRRVAAEGRQVKLDLGLAAALAAALPAAHLVDACSTDRVVTTVRERAALAARYDADVVDMEGMHLAVALAAKHRRFAMVRVVSDDATRDLPALEHAIGAGGRLDVARTALAFVRRPRAAAAFVRGARAALAALSETARVIASAGR
ncbi:MAG: hypothetical protein ABI186_05230 [Candidatus Elarobacter sp.]